VSSTVPIALFGWIPVVLILFALLPGRRALVAAYVGAWLFLPMAGYDVTGLPPYDKTTATAYGALLGTALFHVNLLVSFRPRWFDVPMVVLCLVSPMATSLTNGLGAYDGMSSMLDKTAEWGLQYFLGRLYFRDLKSLKDLAVGVFLGGLIYLPLVLYEVRMSPQLHVMVYGFFPHEWVQTKRFGGWRPQVFMQHGLMVGMWMAMTTLLAAWLWRAKLLPRVPGGIMAGVVGVMTITTVVSRSLGALVLMIIGAGVLWVCQTGRVKWPLIVLLCLPPLYMSTRVIGAWEGGFILDTAAMINEERASSFQFRINNEDLLIDKAMRKPLLGWGGYGRNRVYNERGDDISITDGLWIIQLGQHGLLGLTALYTLLLMPMWLVLRRLPKQELARPPFAAATGLAVVVCLYAIDCLPNGMVNPIFMLAGAAVIEAVSNYKPGRAGLTSKAEPETAARRPRASGQFVPISQRL